MTEKKEHRENTSTGGRSKVDELKDMMQGKRNTGTSSEASMSEEGQVLEDHQFESGLEQDEYQGSQETDQNLHGGALMAAQQQAQEYKESYVRLLAEFENFKKRMEREKADTLQYANEKILKDILTIYDNLEMAILQSGLSQDPLSTSEGKGDSSNSSKKNLFLEGVEMTLRVFQTTLEKYGVQVIDGTGETFDPNMQESIAAVPHADFPSQTVVTVHRKGFKLHNRVLRAALVTIAQ